ncbi:hypothetical protein NBRC10513v2_000223 [Rhodotorula toruloides]|uniref:Uncharacterized protein n=1 Tax=Rhodotorula toruloides TaxID=5286 RepID=A0A0K3C9B2_RHOTO|nr:hypothetical protein AAT19DRAFT_12484 [Rhodotorula toruloides]
MVRLTSSLALLALAAAPAVHAGPLALLQRASDGAVRFGLGRVLRLNETQIERLLNRDGSPLEPHPHAFDLTDDNWETVLGTATYDNPYAAPVGREDVWVVTVHGNDPASKVFVEAMDEVAAHNSSGAGGTLPANMRFARLSYARETIPTTKWWIWKTPVIVIGTNNMRELRFIEQGQVRPNVATLSELFSRPDVWETLPVWKGMLAPGGRFEDRLLRFAKLWAKVHSGSSKIPNFVLLALSGFLMNFVVTWFHKDDAKLQAEYRARAAREQAEEAKLDGAAAFPAPKTAATTATPKRTTRASKRK